MEKELIYRDENFEAEARAGIEASHVALQKLLDVWNGLNLVPLEDSFPLMMNAQKVYGEAVKQVAEVPIAAGRFQINKDAFLQILDIPVPNDLYIAARKAKGTPFSGYRELWRIEGDKIVIVQEVADSLIYAKNVYAENEAQKEFDLDVVKYIELGHKINDKIAALPATGTSYGVPWTVEGRTFPGLILLKLEPEMLREVNKHIH